MMEMFDEPAQQPKQQEPTPAPSEKGVDPELFQRALQGDSNAQFRMYQMNMGADGKPIDLERMKYWLKLAAENGHLEALYIIGFTAVKLGDVKTGMEMLELSAAGNYTEALVKLAELYDNGLDCVAVDHHKAFNYYLRAANAGDPEAMFAVAVDYRNGEGIEKDSTEAFKWYLKAAEKGLERAYYVVGYCYSEGEGVAKNVTQSFYWYKKSAMSGVSEAMIVVAVCYCKGEGVEANPQAAIDWAELADRYGNEDAKGLLDNFEKLFALKHIKYQRNRPGKESLLKEPDRPSGTGSRAKKEDVSLATVTCGACNHTFKIRGKKPGDSFSMVCPLCSSKIKVVL